MAHLELVGIQDLVIHGHPVTMENSNNLSENNKDSTCVDNAIVAVKNNVPPIMRTNQTDFV